jgi:hypothetical protein
VDVESCDIVHVSDFAFVAVLLAFLLGLAFPFVGFDYYRTIVVPIFEEFEVDIDLFVAEMFEAVSVLFGFFLLQNGFQAIDIGI